MREEDCKIGNTVRITQSTIDKGKVGKILEPSGSPDPQYYIIEGCKHNYRCEQMELVESIEPIVINNYQIF